MASSAHDSKKGTASVQMSEKNNAHVEQACMQTTLHTSCTALAHLDKRDGGLFLTSCSGPALRKRMTSSFR